MEAPIHVAGTTAQEVKRFGNPTVHNIVSGQSYEVCQRVNDGAAFITVPTVRLSLSMFYAQECGLMAIPKRITAIRQGPQADRGADPINTDGGVKHPRR